MLRAAALTAYRSQPEFEKLAVGQKRVANILKNQPTPVLPVEELMREPSEIELWKQSKGIVPELSVALKAQDYQTAFRLLLGLRPTIDKFFDDVLVMDKDQKVRANRLNLLSYVRSVFGTVADLSKIVIEGE
jgi:glycyl-tRNA synthetase beta chain